MWSCFEDLVMKKIIVQPKFNIDALYIVFFISEYMCMWWTSTSYTFLRACVLELDGDQTQHSSQTSNRPAQINVPQYNYCMDPSGDGLQNHHLK